MGRGVEQVQAAGEGAHLQEAVEPRAVLSHDRSADGPRECEDKVPLQHVVVVVFGVGRECRVEQHGQLAQEAQVRDRDDEGERLLDGAVRVAAAQVALQHVRDQLCDVLVVELLQ